MIDWTTIIVAIISMAAGVGGTSVLSYFLFRKQTVKKEDLDVILKDSSAANGMLEFTKNMNEFKDGIIENLQKTVTQQNDIIQEKNIAYEILKGETDANRKKIQMLSITQTDHERKLKGINDVLRQEIGRKKYAERLICVRELCAERKPELGSFKTPDPEISTEKIRNNVTE